MELQFQLILLEVTAIRIRLRHASQSSNARRTAQ